MAGESQRPQPANGRFLRFFIMKASIAWTGVFLLLGFTADAAVRYVDLASPGASSPFTSWATAATNIQDAVDAAVAGDEIVVTNGWYTTGGRPAYGTMTNRVVVDKAVSVRSVNGPQFTLIQGSLAPGTVFGESAIRCVYLTNGASLTGFTLTNGATHSSGSVIQELSGGGVWCNSTSALVANCIMAGNHAQVQGGGAYGGTLNNCLFYGNSSTNAGATFSNVLNNCTIVGNSSIFGAGGVHSATLNNSIVYFNTGFPANYQQCTINYSCTTPQPAAGSGNITADPMLVDWLSGNFQLYPASSCVNAGNNALAPAGPDLAGNGRIFNGTVDIGAYECYGDVTNAAGAHYVAANSPNPVPPYTSWATAALTIQDAIDVAVAGDEIVVTNGVYASGGRAVGTIGNNRVAVDRAVTVRSVNGPQFTLIQGFQVPDTTLGPGAVRCVYLATNAVISGFTLTNGATLATGPYGSAWGGGVYCETSDGLVLNCVLTGNSAIGGGGASGATLKNCLLVGNSGYDAGGAWLSTLMNCTVVGNSATSAGGGVYNIWATNCIVYFNSAPAGANYYGPNGGFGYCCTTPQPGGIGNFGSDPAFVNPSGGNYRLQSFSKCINAGNNLYATAGLDLDGNSRIIGLAVDLGAYEYQGSSTSSAPYILFQPTNQTVTVGSNASFGILAGGSAPLFYQWRSNSVAIIGATNFSLTVTNAQLSYSGTLYSVTITNTAGSIASSNALLRVLSAPVTGTRYVNANSANPAPPYTTWAAAARTIQDAVDAALDGDDVVVTNGVYATGGRALYGTMTNRVAVTNAVWVRSVNGPQFTIIEGRQVPGSINGDGAIRCVQLDHSGARLSGFTLRNGATRTGGDMNNEQCGGGLLIQYGISAVASNCIIAGNASATLGGGVQRGTLYNCALYQNTCGYAGGAGYETTMVNCTVVGNVDNYGAGGMYGGSFNNCIVYFNQPANHYGGRVNFCCTTPMPYSWQGSANITADPQLASFTHLSLGSPCRSAGYGSVTAGTDLDGEAWRSPPAIGCDEINPGAATGALTVDLTATLTSVTPLYTVSFTAFIEGRTTASVWDFGDGVTVNNQPFTTHAWEQAGDYPVVLTAYNDSNPAGVSATLLVHVVSAPVHYVFAGSPSPAAPFSSWATAATNIQDAIDAATIPGALVLVSNGVYSSGGMAVHGTMTNRVAVNKALTVRSINGPEATIIQGWQLPGCTNGDGAIRCVYLTNGANLTGFTLTSGATQTNGDYSTQIVGGGAWCMPGAVLSNCVVQGNSAAESGGGVYRGLLADCLISDNRAGYGGGCFGSTLARCTVTRNFAWNAGGGGYGAQFGQSWLTDNVAMGDGGGACNSTLTNCALVGNTATNGGGLYNSYGGQVFGCTVVSNSAVNGGGVYGFTNVSYYNCIVYFNSAANGSNYSGAPYGGIPIWFIACCTAPPPAYAYNSLSSDPLFVNLESRNLRLQPTSPCVDAGLNAYASASPDLDGHPRIVGERVDIGAYEFQDSQPPLGIAQFGGGIRLYWPLWASDFSLQEIEAIPLSPGGWSNLTVYPSTTNNENSVFQPLNGELRYYRLFRP